MNITTASNQWASRPDDQRYLSLDDLAAAVSARRDLSRASNVRLDSLTVDNDQDGQILLTPPDGPVWSGPLHQLEFRPATRVNRTGGGYAANSIGSDVDSAGVTKFGYQRLKATPRSLLSTLVRTWSSRWALFGAQRICCFFTIRLLTI